MKTELLFLPLLALTSLVAEESPISIAPEKVKQEHVYASFGLGF